MVVRDPALPTLDALSRERTPYMVDLDDYKTDLHTGLSSAWKLAQENIKIAQTRQKITYDRTAKEPTLKVGQRVMVTKYREVRTTFPRTVPCGQFESNEC